MNDQIWTLEFTTQSRKQFLSLDQSIQKKILGYFEKNILCQKNPHKFGKPMQEELKGY